jgi:hypothetical protein
MCECFCNVYFLCALCRIVCAVFCTVSFMYIKSVCGLGSSVGIATDYGLDGPGIEKTYFCSSTAHFAHNLNKLLQVTRYYMFRMKV